METHRQFFNTFITLKPINIYAARSKNVLFKPLCKKNFSKFKLLRTTLHGINLLPNNDLLEAVTINMFKIRLKEIIFASINILEDL